MCGFVLKTLERVVGTHIDLWHIETQIWNEKFRLPIRILNR